MEPAPHGDASAQWWPKRWRRRTGLAGRAGLGGVHRSWSWEPHARAPPAAKGKAKRNTSFGRSFLAPCGRGQSRDKECMLGVESTTFLAQS